MEEVKIKPYRKVKMKYLLIIVLFVCALSITHAQTVGYLTYGDSTEIYYGSTNNWVRFFLIDSTTSSDTVLCESYNPWSATWAPITVRDDSSNTYSAVIVVPYGKAGHSYTVWMDKPGTIRLRRTDTANIADKLYYYIFAR